MAVLLPTTLLLLPAIIASRAGEPVAATVSSTPTTAPSDRPSLDRASQGELAALDGVGPDVATRIVALRTERGRLGSVEALRVLDLPDATLDHLRDQVAVDLPIHKVASAKTYSSVDEVLREFAGEPDVRAVQSMAMEYTKTHPSLVDGWITAAKTTYLLPRVTFDYGKDLERNDKFNVTGLADDPEVLWTDRDLDNDDFYDVEVQWYLHKLVMSSEKIRVISEAQDIVKLRDKVLDEVTRLYFDRRRLQVEQLMNPPGDLPAQIKNELRLQEIAANLDAYTGGQFSAAVSRGGAQ